MAEMYELHITNFPPLAHIDFENQAVVGVPMADYLTGPFVSVLTHGGALHVGPAGSMGPVTPEMIERGLEVLRHIADDIDKHNERQQRRDAAPYN